MRCAARAGSRERGLPDSTFLLEPVLRRGLAPGKVPRQREPYFAEDQFRPITREAPEIYQV